MAPLAAGPAWTLARVQRDDGEPVLVKLANDDAGPRSIAQLERELAVTSRLADPGVLAARGLERHGSRLALVYEPFAGEPLRVGAHERREGPAVFALAIAVTEILVRLHARDAIHRSLHPEAIWVGPDGQVKLAELGRTSLPGLAPPPALDALSGPIAYLAPEQSGRTDQALDARADLYALGAVLYALLAGAPPFHGQGPLEMLHAHLTQLPAPLGSRAPGTPPALAAIVHTLLAKNPEERYASAAALLYDLRGAAALPAGAPFVPRREGPLARLNLPDRLYGREDARRQLRAALARTFEGECAVCLVAAPSGGGKTSLVQDLAAELGERVRFAAGKFEAQRTGEPFSALTQALGGLLRQVLSSRESEVAAWRERLRRGVGTGLPVLAETLPEVQAIVGPQPPPAPLPAGEARQRLQLALQRFVACFAVRERPLLLLLDDLQWADAASLRLCEALAGGIEVRHLLLVGAYRSADVAPGHPLHATLVALRAASPPPTEIELASLGRAELELLLRDALGPAGSLRALADELLRRTQGNPLFAREFLRFLHREAGLALDPATDQWTWTLADVDATRVPETIAELLGSELRMLPPASQHAVRVAACLGARFELDTLARALAAARDDTALLLQPALALGLLIPSGPPGQPAAQLRFFHDRVRQAAYADRKSVV